MARVIVGSMHAPAPVVPSTSAATNQPYAAPSASWAANAAYPKVARAIPVPITRIGGTRSISRPDTWMLIPAATACGIISRPVVVAVSPRATWK